MDLSDFALHALLDALHEGVYIVDRNWKLTYMNPSAERLTGFSTSAETGLFCRSVFKTDRCEDECPLFRALELGQPLRDTRMAITRKDGATLQVLVNSSELKDETGETTGGIMVFRPVDSAQRGSQLAAEDHFEGMIGRDRSVLEVFELIEQVAGLETTVLITGESGTGKELAADAIVARSPRRNKAYVKVNCSVFAENLLESELFGHVKGAFTGAYTDRAGRFETADGGTIFLDEIGEASPAVQLKLLRVLQSREFEPVGGSRTIKVDVRVIAATNRDLRKLIAEGKFREDLFYRLSTVPMELPPLRKRGNDVLLLVESLFNRLKNKNNYPKAQLTDECYDALARYQWPGNVRQLENALEYSMIRARGGSVQLGHLPPEVRENQSVISINDQGGSTAKARVLRALRDTNWNRQKACELLGISRTTLWRLMKQYKMEQ